MTRFRLRGAKLPRSPSSISREPRSEAGSPRCVDGLAMLPWGAAGRGSRAPLPLSDEPRAQWGSYPSGLSATPTFTCIFVTWIHVLPVPFLPLSGATELGASHSSGLAGVPVAGPCSDPGCGGPGPHGQGEGEGSLLQGRVWL